ncbi:MAG: TetR/AcrR family transcriptional regulator [Saccharospirillaceae bacterium]|nr:TetR/AcrR family transcriptional regulator [Pseudomonadales bacterium]NRB77087.1 TetR/AcrR family transcriptional regulator [Saccharospirillaceae bacterium]
MANTALKSDPKERILKTAQRLFYQQGFRATGINQIIKEAKVAKASFYDHFDSKDDLGLAYLTDIARLSQCDCSNILKSDDDPKKAILGLFDFIEKQFKKMNFIGCPMQNITSEISLEINQPFQMVVIDRKDQLRNDIKDVLQTLTQQSVNHKQLNVETVSDSLFLLIEGAMTSSRIYRDIWPFKAARQTAELILS